jgi:UDP-glucose 4-epimerase
MMGSGRESRDFIHGLDIAHAVFQIANTAPMQGESYNLGSGQEVTISDLVNMVLPIIKSDLEPQFDGIVPPGTPLNWRADISTLTALGFTPSISLEQGLEDYVEWYLSDLKHAG